MKITSTILDGVLLIEPVCYQDERGLFLETYQECRYKELGIHDHFIQDNQSRSQKNVLRGLHFNINKPQAQLVTVMRGHIFDVVVDIRPESSTYGKWFGAELCDDGVRQIYMAPGFAHGFCVLSDFADLHYKVTQFYELEDDGGLMWNDLQIQIDWPIRNPIISKKDQNNICWEGLNVEK